MNSRKILCVLSISKANYPKRLRDHQLNYKAWEAMARRCDRVYLVGLSTDTHSSLSHDGRITLYRIPKLPGLAGLFAFIAGAVAIGLWLCIRRGINVLDSADPFSAGFSSVILKTLTGLPLVLHVQGELFNLPPERFSDRHINWAKKVSVWCGRRADKVRVVSQKIADQAVIAGVPVEKLIVLPSRCDTIQFNPDKWRARGAAVRRELGWSDCRIVLFIGGLNLSKGVSTILEGFASLSHRFVDVRLLIVGDGPLRSQLEQQSESLGLGRLARFYGRVPYDAVPALLSAGDLFVSPSLDEGMPRSVLEAMAMNLPVVVTPVGGNMEIVSDGINGLLVPPKDPSALEAAISDLLSNPERMLEMGKVGRQRVIENHEFELQIERLSNLHRNLAGIFESRC